MTDERGRPESLLMRSVEGSLSPEEQAELDRMLADHPHLSRDLRDITILGNVMTTDKERIFCPNTADLFSYAENGTDPDGRIAHHLTSCERCRDEVAAYRAECTEAPSSQALEAFRAVSAAAKSHQAETGGLAALWDRISSHFSFPVLIGGTAAVAAILLVVVMYTIPHKPRTMIAVSAIQWTDDRPLFMGGSKSSGVEKRPEVAVTLLLKGAAASWSQERIDRLYRAIEPPPLVKNKYEFLSPHRVKESLKPNDVKEQTADAIRKTVYRELKSALTLSVTVTYTDHEATVNARLIDSKTGAIKGSAVRTTSEAGAIDETARSAVMSVLQPTE